ncbi:MAG TPA: M23 family metallopeptidase [Chitinophagales bacterium]|nr:M23 family metallopeptidase [Chitinophagales bacterium]
MKNDTNQKKGFFKNIKSLYRFQIIDTNNYEVKWVIEMSKLNMFVLGWICIFVLLFLAFLFFALTPLRYLLPGYVGTNATEKREMIDLRVKTDALEEKINLYDQYISNIQSVINDSIGLHSDYLQSSDRTTSDSAYYFPEASKFEVTYRKDFEKLLSGDQAEEKSGSVFILKNMHLPAEGKPIIKEESDKYSKTLKIKAKGDASVYSVLPGVIIAQYSIGGQKHIFIQHDYNILSIYKFEGILKLEKGEKVILGQLVGVMSEEGEDVLSFDLWEGTEPIAAGQFFKF